MIGSLLRYTEYTFVVLVQQCVFEKECIVTDTTPEKCSINGQRKNPLTKGNTGLFCTTSLPLASEASDRAQSKAGFTFGSRFAYTWTSSSALSQTAEDVEAPSSKQTVYLNARSCFRDHRVSPLLHLIKVSAHSRALT